MTKTLLAITLMAGFNLSAGSLVQVTFTGTGTFGVPGDGVTNGTDHVLPYYLSINGSFPLPADSCDFFDPITVGETWAASIDSLYQAAVAGKFYDNYWALLGYEQIGVLSMMPTPSAQSKIDLQDTIWNVFAPGSFTVDTGMAWDLAIANTGIATFDFSSVEYIEPLYGANIQAFVMPSGLVSATPEPSTMLLLGAGIISLGLVKRRV